MNKNKLSKTNIQLNKLFSYFLNIFSLGHTMKKNVPLFF